MVREAWELAKKDRTIDVKNLLKTESDADVVMSTDACGRSDDTAIKQHPAGLGAVVHSCKSGVLAPGTRFMQLIPTDHPMAEKPIAWLELFMSILWIRALCRKNWTCVIYTDNTNAQWWMSKFKAKPL